MTAGALLTFTVALAAAQTGPVTFSGSVFDSTGAPVPGATVVLTNTQTKAKFEVTSGDFGQFTFVPLPADTYVLAASLPGFKKAEDSVTLTGKSVKRDVRLNLGELQETITVRGVPGGVPAGVSGGVPGGIQTRLYDRTGFQKDLESCKASSAGGRVRPPRKIKDVRPLYPSSLVDAKIAGKVLMKAIIAVDGTVRDVQVVKSAQPDLDNAAVEAVRQWLFDGTLLNCTPVEVTMNVSIDFGVQ
jgi:TonB family protein